MTDPSAPVSPAAPIVLTELAGRFAMCRFAPAADVPEWMRFDGELVSVTRTRDELSIIAADDAVPGEVQAERGFMALAVVGPLEFSIVGLLARLAAALAEAHVPMLAVSTYNTDILLVKAEHRDAAIAALSHVARVVPAS